MDRLDKVFVFCTHPDNSGGVANLYRTLKPHLPDHFVYMYVGSRQSKPGCLYFPLLLLQFVFFLFKYNVRGIIFNPSLGVKALARDSVFIAITKFIGIRHLVFFHGWDSTLLAHPFWCRIFKFTTLGNCVLLVLATEFREQSGKIAPSAKIEVFRTAIDLPDNEHITEKLRRNADVSKRSLELLFLGRLEESKGVLDVITAASKLNEKCPDCLVLHIAGGGALQDTVRKLSEQKGFEFVRFHGYVRGEKKDRLFARSDVFAFPTRHSEGLPVAVLEAMAHGLCIVAPLIGGLKCQVGGSVIKQLHTSSVDDLVQVLVELQESPHDRVLRQERGVLMARHFEAKVVARDLLEILNV